MPKKLILILIILAGLLGAAWGRLHLLRGSASAAPDAVLSHIVTTWAGGQNFHASVAVEELTGEGRSADMQADAHMVAASTFKLYVAYAVLHAIEQGRYTLDTTTPDGNSIQTDLTNMIVNSDNDAARTLGFMLGWPNIDQLLTTIGIKSTNLNNYDGSDTTPDGDKYSTATDLSTLLHKLYDGTLLNAAHQQLLLGLMEKQEWRERIPAGVPSGITVADKPGWLGPADGEDEYVENDAAIVYGPKSTYILVILTDGSQTQPLANLSSQIYKYLEE